MKNSSGQRASSSKWYAIDVSRQLSQFLKTLLLHYHVKNLSLGVVTCEYVNVLTGCVQGYSNVHITPEEVYAEEEEFVDDFTT